MADREDAVDLLMVALAGEARPIASARVLEVARATLDRTKADQFVKWFGPNGGRLLEKLNG